MSRIVKGVIYRLRCQFGRLYCIFKGISLGDNVRINKFPLISKSLGAQIYLGDGVTLNSNNHGYHLNMYSRCKLYADMPNAKIFIGNNTRIHGTCIHAQSEITIGSNCLIAANTNIIDANGHLLSFDKPEERINTRDIPRPIHIEDNVWIGANTLILGGTIIGAGSVVAANSVVKGIIPPLSLVGGNPAVVIKQF